MPEPALRILIADDNPVVRAGLTVLLGGRDDIEVVAEAVDGHEAVRLARLRRPDVVLLDVRMPGMDGISALPYLVDVAPVMMLTYSSEDEIVREALRLGAGGYLVHGEFSAEELLRAVRDVREGRAHLTPSAATALLAQARSMPGAPGPLPDGLGGVLPALPPQPGIHRRTSSQTQPLVARSSERAHNHADHGLSSREVEIMELIATGMSNQQIAATCFISEKTVKNHINRIFAKLHTASRSEAIALWLGTARPGVGHV
ncbi:response regulator transcription factor [Streptomyces sp. NRRL S-87]|uniref:response regulator n=1 Tax=Streptomyces sp. NRRL S-87 TaxID=1463920 RepID=UPI00068B9D37|nr:response regulator transcription factor [Streptomyces sp. NRRL S-87]